MGWSYNHKPRQTKADFIAEVVSPREFGPGYEVVDRRVVGSNVWVLLRYPNGEVSILLGLLNKESTGWGVKYISENAFPYYYDCPVALLDRCTEPRGKSAAEWRQKVRDRHAAIERQKAALETGRIVSYGGTEYRLHSPAGPRKGWHVTRRSDGAMFRMPAKQLLQATIV